MKSSEFNPQQQTDFRWLQKAMPSVPEAQIADVPDEFSGAILYVNAGKNIKEKNTSIPWNSQRDELIIAEQTTYNVNADGAWKDNRSSAWHGKKMQLQINCPDGILGSLYVHFRDWNNNKRRGMLIFEGRKVKLEKHEGEGQWVKFHVMREDSNDGKLVLITDALTGPNLMITKVVLVKE
ncbi:MAG: hypothetical protein KAI29_12380 [Cyclobacteriaceae bacterium]|nr:hypothetical protein [Cyclobacteriaceae bacterium]